MGIKIKQLAIVQMGYSFRSRLEPSGNGNVAVIQMKDLLRDNTVSCKKLDRIEMEEVKKHHLARKGDLVFRSRGLIIASAILLEDPGKAVVAAPLLKIRIGKTDQILPEYLNWYISQKDAQIFLKSRSMRMVQKMISKQAIEEMEVCVPSLKRQQQIVDLANLSLKESIILGKLAEKRELYMAKLLNQLIIENNSIK